MIPTDTAAGLRRRDWVLASGARYWPTSPARIAALPLPASGGSPDGSELWQQVELPAWAHDLGVDGALLVDTCCVEASAEGPIWQRCDWLQAAFLHLTGAHERRYEREHGPTQSYAARLAGAHPALFDQAWANRIFLFLRRWAAREAGADETALFGALPEPELILTHDVDAIRKTAEIRVKQAGFHVFNAARSLRAGALARAAKSLSAGFRFAARPASFHTLGAVRRLENERGLRSILHFYAGPAGWSRRTLGRLLIDPAYDIADPYLRGEMRLLAEGGWTIGLHQSTAAWNEAAPMAAERQRLAEAAGVLPQHCRQHWLRFSWKDTWRAQQQAGLTLDSTLGFNDRPGFRNGAALRLRPWDAERGEPLAIEALPMIFMDSHFYDYQPVAEGERRSAMQRWIEEVRAVHGQASVNWHTHTITDAYGWGTGYDELLDILAD